MSLEAHANGVTGWPRRTDERANCDSSACRRDILKRGGSVLVEADKMDAGPWHGEGGGRKATRFFIITDVSIHLVIL